MDASSNFIAWQEEKLPQVSNGESNDYIINTEELPPEQPALPIFRQGEMSGPLSSLLFRTLYPGDIDQIRSLHEDWFPVKYKEAFYVGAVQEKFLTTSKPLYTEVATSNEELLINGAAPDIFFTTRPQWRDESIVGAIICQGLTVKECEDKDIFASASQHTKVMYILTLGAARSWRRKGVASELVRRCIQEASLDKECGLVYLHVITYNQSAINFYAKMGFRRLRRLKNYYHIDNIYYDAYIYVYYINGGRPPLSGWTSYFFSPLYSLASYLAREVNKWLSITESSNQDKNITDKSEVNGFSSRPEDVV